jgi:hypothetical protein
MIKKEAGIPPVPIPMSCRTEEDLCTLSDKHSHAAKSDHDFRASYPPLRPPPCLPPGEVEEPILEVRVLEEEARPRSKRERERQICVRQGTACYNDVELDTIGQRA